MVSSVSFHWNLSYFSNIIFMLCVTNTYRISRAEVQH